MSQVLVFSVYTVVTLLTVTMGVGRVLTSNHWPTDTFVSAMLNAMVAECYVAYLARYNTEPTPPTTSPRVAGVSQQYPVGEVPPDADSDSEVGESGSVNNLPHSIRTYGVAGHAFVLALSVMSVTFGLIYLGCCVYGSDMISYRGNKPQDHTNQVYLIPSMLSGVGALMCIGGGIWMWMQARKVLLRGVSRTLHTGERKPVAGVGEGLELGVRA
ncbi:hypothetical protein KIPB_003297 [Kipferlia bialata]|uniref:Phosphatidic acid phosphatase type 2/haloperoxidase domain-containing protein n=1 Tax=Kipferlia bialata TaxID=797122 RepID=A0A391NJX0_9EUKA|nr:hypothetical protein KIPB_003297 [Kipferlia bialata]|eukprot:g3297.t1